MRRDGFSLIEALVALAIAAVCLVALFGLQQELAHAQRRYEAALVRAEARRNILALVRDLNPAAQPQGETTLPAGESLRWRSRPRGPVARALTTAGAASPFVVQLYEVEAALQGPDGRARDTVTLERMGWRRVAASPGPGGSTSPTSP